MSVIAKYLLWSLTVLAIVHAATPAAWWQPTPAVSWDIQITGIADPNISVAVYDVDLFKAPQSLIDTLKGQGKKVICYFSAGSYEDYRPDIASFPSEILGNALGGWPDERWLDIRRFDLLGPIMIARMDLAVQKRCDAVDPDNVDGYLAKNGFGWSASDQLVYNRWLSVQAHQRNLSVGLKNDMDQASDLINDFDFAINEQCFQYSQCQVYAPWIAAGKAVFSIEYKGSALSVCPRANTARLSTLLKGLDLSADGQTKFCVDSSFVPLVGWTQAPGLLEDLANMDNDSSSSSLRVSSLLLTTSLLWSFLLYIFGKRSSFC